MCRLLTKLICPFSCHVLRFFRIIESSESDTASKRGRSSLRPLVSKGQYLCLLKIDIKDDASLFQNPYSMAILGKKCALPTTTYRPVS